MTRAKPNTSAFPGKVFGYLTAIKFAGRLVRYNRKMICWHFDCVCGKRVIRAVQTLKPGKQSSCGCKLSEIYKTTHLTHGKSRTRTHRIWMGMNARCLNKSKKEYPRYGGRGIKVCKRWRNSFINFYKDMGEAPPGLSIDRIDNNKGYSKKNCKWSTSKEQGFNKRSSVKATVDGRTLCLKEWSTVYNIPYQTLLTRINRAKMSILEALLTPVQKYIKVHKKWNTNENRSH